MTTTVAATDDAGMAPNRPPVTAGWVRQQIARGRLVAWTSSVFTRSGQFAGCEVLARCPAPDGGLLSATAFGDLLEVEDWALVDRSMAHAAARLSRAIVAGGGPPAWVSWNTAPSTLSDAYADELEAIVARAGGDRSHLHLELTEQRPVPGVSEIGVLHRFVGAGFGVALDDVGRQHEPLDLLRQVPFRLAKLERELIAAAVTESGFTQLRDLTSACHAHGARVVAEGVETAAELEAVLDAGCDEIQGFLWARGCSAATLAHEFAMGRRPEPAGTPPDA
ncbi:MAG: EAL domain-containing protein [Ilumatobacteraceae bacterium]